MSQFDLVVIGSGPGGYVAAIKAGQLGLKVALVEKDNSLGGTCLNVGCIPSKALLHSTEVYQHAVHGKKHGLVGAEKLTFDVAAMLANKDKVVAQLNMGVGALRKKRNVEIVRGLARDDHAAVRDAAHRANAAHHRARVVPGRGSVDEHLEHRDVRAHGGLVEEAQVR